MNNQLLELKEWTHDGRPEINRYTLPDHRVANGPWNDEPDKRYWIDAETGLDCLMVRAPTGGWCGYVGVPEGHPFFEKDYDQCTHNPGVKKTEKIQLPALGQQHEYEISTWDESAGCGQEYCGHTPNANIDVHGGLTFANFCHESEKGEGYGICHTPVDGRPERIWWLGFDCAHVGDLTPMDVSMELAHPELARYKTNDVYRDVEYVEAEVQCLARQLKDLE